MSFLQSSRSLLFFAELYKLLDVDPDSCHEELVYIPDMLPEMFVFSACLVQVYLLKSFLYHLQMLFSNQCY